MLKSQAPSALRARKGGGGKGKCSGVGVGTSVVVGGGTTTTSNASGPVGIALPPSQVGGGSLFRPSQPKKFVSPVQGTGISAPGIVGQLGAGRKRPLGAAAERKGRRKLVAGVAGVARGSADDGNSVNGAITAAGTATAAGSKSTSTHAGGAGANHDPGAVAAAPSCMAPTTATAAGVVQTGTAASHHLPSAPSGADVPLRVDTTAMDTETSSPVPLAASTPPSGSPALGEHDVRNGAAMPPRQHRAPSAPVVVVAAGSSLVSALREPVHVAAALDRIESQPASMPSPGAPPRMGLFPHQKQVCEATHTPARLANRQDATPDAAC